MTSGVDGIMDHELSAGFAVKPEWQEFAMTAEIKRAATMVERVARALYENASGDILAWKHEEWSETNEFVKGAFCTMARAALEAMRDPTDEMLAAGDENGLLEIWHRMIDAALSGDEPRAGLGSYSTLHDDRDG